ncbi:hypothetical protein F5Y16DRAFT_243773 [Xylariaceae sp. FL0255]|nr:hypothetical protein F5Y16DRAFT_243773 [Xylariaceae sp. FL0255]
MEQTSSGQGDDGNPPNISQNHTQAGAQEPRTTNHLTNGNQPNGIVNGIVETSSPEVAGSPVIAQPVVGPPSQEPVVNHDQHPRRTSRHHLILPSPLSLLRRSRQNPRPVATSPAQQFDNPPQPPNEEEEHILNIHSVPPSTISPIPISPPQSESLLHTLSIRPPIPSYQSASTQTSTPQGILLEASTAAVSRIVPASPGSSQAECSVPAQLEPDATAPQSPDLTPRTPRGAVSRTCTTTPHLPITTPKGSGEKPSSPSTTSEISRQSTATAGFPIYISINQVAQPTSSFVANIQPTVMATYVALAQPQQQGCYYYYPGYQGQVFTTAPPGFRSKFPPITKGLP